ncbi:hypothetical protein JTB14_036377 [Gonioctena quinquepunctata]|nr:hypothetical protein JTB14_036377 [Gonioctena quinquepunctata]
MQKSRVADVQIMMEMCHIRRNHCLNSTNQKKSLKHFLKPVTRKDFGYLMCSAKFGKFLGLVPSVSSSGQPRTGSALHGFILLNIWITFCYFCIKEKLNFSKDFTISVRLIIIILGFVEATFVSSCIISSAFFHRSKWCVLIRMMEKFEKMCTNKVNTQTMHCTLLKLVSIYFNFLFVFGLQYYYWVEEGFVDILIGYTDTAVCYFYEIAHMAYYILFSNWLKNKYEYLDEQLYLVVKNDGDGKIKMDKIIESCKYAFRLVQQSESIFSRIIFFQVCTMVLDVLCTMSYALFNNDLLDFHGQMLNFLFAIIYPISLTIMVMSCDSLEKSGQKMIKTCYALHLKLENGNIKEQMLLLAEYMEEWRPILSAGGFYALNRKCLLKIFSSFVTYLFVILQFTLTVATNTKNSQ